jgi:predicted RNase H-like HicB family nuclease
MQYPIAIEWGSETEATGIIFPDIPGAATAADTLEDAYKQAAEVAHLQLEELISSGGELPMPTRISELRAREEYDGWGWGIIDIDVSAYLGRTEKVNVTLPGIVIRRIDDYVRKHGLKSRSAFLADVALEKLAAK